MTATLPVAASVGPRPSAVRLGLRAEGYGLRSEVDVRRQTADVYRVNILWKVTQPKKFFLEAMSSESDRKANDNDANDAV